MDGDIVSLCTLVLSSCESSTAGLVRFRAVCFFKGRDMAEIVSAEIVLRELLQDSLKCFEEKKSGHQEILKAAAYKAATKDFLLGKDLSPPQLMRLMEAAKSAAAEITDARAVVMVCTDRLTASQAPAVQPPPPPPPTRPVVGDREDDSDSDHDEQRAAVGRGVYARKLEHLPVWQDEDFATEKGKKNVSLWGQRDRLSQLAVVFVDIRRLLPQGLITTLTAGSLEAPQPACAGRALTVVQTLLDDADENVMCQAQDMLMASKIGWDGVEEVRGSTLELPKKLKEKYEKALEAKKKSASKFGGSSSRYPESSNKRSFYDRDSKDSKRDDYRRPGPPWGKYGGGSSRK